MRKTFTEYWQTLAAPERDNTAIALSSKCNTALSTVLSWGLGYRTPKVRSQEIIAKYLASKGLATDVKTLFPN